MGRSKRLHRMTSHDPHSMIYEHDWSDIDMTNESSSASVQTQMERLSCPKSSVRGVDECEELLANSYRLKAVLVGHDLFTSTTNQ